MYTSPAVKPGELFFYFDPIDTLPEESQRRWSLPEEQDAMMAEAAESARRSLQDPRR